MSEHFNRLSPGQDERLALLAEELAEAIVAIGKIQRHGYESHDPTNPQHRGNRADLENELGDVLFAIDLATERGDLDYGRIVRAKTKKFLSVGQYLHHNEVP